MYSMYIDGFKSFETSWCEVINFIQNYSIIDVNSIISELTKDNATIFNTKYNNNVVIVKA